MKRLLFIFIALLSFVSFTYAQTCGDGVTDPGEACDSRADNISFGSLGDELPYALCDDFDPSLTGPLGCYGTADNSNLLCQFHVGLCQPLEECISCEDCEFILGIGCSHTLLENSFPEAEAGINHPELEGIVVFAQR